MMPSRKASISGASTSRGPPIPSEKKSVSPSGSKYNLFSKSPKKSPPSRGISLENVRARIDKAHPSRETLAHPTSIAQRKQTVRDFKEHGSPPTARRSLFASGNRTSPKRDIHSILSNVTDMIKKKRNGDRLTNDDIHQIVAGIVNGTLPESQIGALLMAIYLRGMNTDETLAMTKAMTHSGRMFSWPDDWHRLVVDKHSTGGIGDKISLILAPALAVCGLKVPMIFNRSLEMAGGTLNKLETIPGIRVHMSTTEIRSILTSVGCCIVSETDELIPADQILYKYRELTATLDSPPLIIASIISKKAAEGLSALVLDVKFGRGSFMKSKEEARHLAYAMVNMGYKMGIKTSAVLSSMDSPMGSTIGNALEVAEALQCLKGQDKVDLKELTMKLGGELLYLLSATSRKEGADIINRILKDGAALSKFHDMIIAQGVRPDVAHKLCDLRGDVWSILPKAPHVTTLQSQMNGFVHHIDALELGRVAQRLGTGRLRTGDVNHGGVGLELLVAVGSSILKGQNWIRVHHLKDDLGDHFSSHLQKALVIRPNEVTSSISRVTEIITQH